MRSQAGILSCKKYYYYYYYYLLTYLLSTINTDRDALVSGTGPHFCVKLLPSSEKVANSLVGDVDDAKTGDVHSAVVERTQVDVVHSLKCICHANINRSLNNNKNDSRKTNDNRRALCCSINST